jgi:hypothetical protein
MKTVLYAWEIGDGFGHIRNLVAIARQLSNYQAVFAIPDSQIVARTYLIKEGFTDIRTFSQPTRISLAKWMNPFAEYRAASYLDVLTCYAYDSVDRFMPLYTQVNAIIADVEAEVIIAESAPTFLIAGKTEALTISTGTSYGTPQCVNSRQALFPQLDDRPLTPLMDERGIEAVIAQSLGRKLNMFPLEHWFYCDETIPLCYPEVDLYEAHRTDFSQAVGPVVQFKPMPITSNDQFAYLSANHPNIKQLMEAIRATSIPTRVYVNGADFHYMSRHSLTIVDSFDLEDELKNCARVIHHGSAGIMQAAMGSGRAQFVFPYHAENTQNVAKMWSLGNVNGAGYAEPFRYHEALMNGYGVELVGANEIANKLAERYSPGENAVADRVTNYLETYHG